MATKRKPVIFFNFKVVDVVTVVVAALINGHFRLMGQTQI
jgi:hypothetical protein